MRSKKLMVLYRSNIGIMVSNPARGTDECPRFSCVVLSCVSRSFAMGRSPAQGILPKYINGFKASEVNSEMEQVRGPNP
jgi:hypothetical protein